MGALRVDILTLFPRMFGGVLHESILKRARESGKVDIYLHDFRNFSYDKHRKVDEPPYGGGPGMVLRPEPIVRAVEAIPGHERARRVLLTPDGERLTQARAAELAGSGQLILISGHYEGFDERVRSILAPEEISIGDYILTGGEIPAMVVLDAVARLVPGVLGGASSAEHESFVHGGLEHPQYTRPASWRGHEVPEVLRSGDHKRIAEWRAARAAERTRARRPDLLSEEEGADDADHRGD